MDKSDSAAPTIFQAMYLAFVRLVFEDELGKKATDTFLDDWYFWQERLKKMVIEGSSKWFDNKKTGEKVETINDLFHQAALEVKARFSDELGKDPNDWAWGKVHTLELVSPTRRTKSRPLWMGTKCTGGSATRPSAPIRSIHCC